MKTLDFDFVVFYFKHRKNNINATMEFPDTFYLPINSVSRDKQFKNEHNFYLIKSVDDLILMQNLLKKENTLFQNSSKILHKRTRNKRSYMMYDRINTKTGQRTIERCKPKKSKSGLSVFTFLNFVISSLSIAASIIDNVNNNNIINNNNNNNNINNIGMPYVYIKKIIV